MVLYADTSALAKLVKVEAESDALRAYLRDRGGLVSSAVASTELMRVARRQRSDLQQQVAGILERVHLIDVDDEVLALAATVDPPEVATLDAIHVATALALGDELEAVLTYDVQMSRAALAAGLRVEAPA